MSGFTPGIGTEVFVEDGRRAVFAGNIGGQNFVRMMLFSDEDYGREEWPSDKLTPVARVYKSEPQEAYGPKIEAARAKLDDLKERVSAHRTILAELDAKVKEASAAVAKYPDLATAIDFFEGRISHVVIDSYGDIKIQELSESLKQKSDYGQFEGLKLICLHGTDDRGKAKWSMSHYSDGSGSKKQIYPFKSLADAEEFVRAQHRFALELWKAGDAKHGAHRFRQCPVALEWPAEFMAELRAKEQKNAAERIAYFKEQMAPYEAVLAGAAISTGAA